MRYAKRFYRSLKKRVPRSIRYLSRHPNSVKPPCDLIDSMGTLMMDKWDKIHETGNVFILSKEENKDYSNKFFRYCLRTWYNIQDQQIKMFGMPDSYNEYWDKACKTIEARLDLCITGDRTYKLFLKIAELNEESASIKKPQSTLKICQSIEVSLGLQPIDLSITSVERYGNYFELIKERAKNVKSN